MPDDGGLIDVSESFPMGVMLRRELRATLRDGRVFLSVAAAVGVMLAALYQVWPTEAATLSELTQRSYATLASGVRVLGWLSIALAWVAVVTLYGGAAMVVYRLCAIYFERWRLRDA